MKKIRIGNDIKIEWSIFKKSGGVFLLEGLDLIVSLKDKFGRKKIDDFVISGNVIKWTFPGKDQRRTGIYSLELVINNGAEGMITTDACQFVNLVACSCDVAGSDESGVYTETIELRSALTIGEGGGEGGGEGYDDTAIWEALNDKVDKVKGKGLSTNDYTNAEKSKLAGLENYDDTKLKEDIENLSKKVEDLEQGGGSADQSDYPTRDEVAETYLPREEFSETIERYATTDSLEDYLTKTEAEEAYQPKGDYASTESVESKQDKIADLETIRQGAAKGATALQSVPDTYATKTYVDEKVAQSGGGGGGEPSQYIKEATTSADGNTLTLTKKDNTQVVFSPNGGGGSSAPSDADRFVAGASPYLVWEDIYGKIHFERKSLETRRGQKDDDFRTTCKKIIAGSPIDINGNMAYLFSTQDSGKVAAVSEIYPYFLSEPSLTVAQYVFANMQNITDWSFIKHFDVSNCETLMGMFVQTNANEIDISSWDVSKVKNMGGSNMFGFTKKVIGLENWNTSKVEGFNLMFAYTQIGDLSGIKMWDVAKVTNFSNMFRGANNIQNLDISQWEIADGANMSAMLAYMEYLTSLGLCNVPHGCNTTQMVIGMTRLADVYMKEGAMIYASLDFKNSPLSATSIKALLSHLGDSPDEGATVTFSSNLYTTLSAEDKAEVDALRINAVEKGWSIVNMG